VKSQSVLELHVNELRQLFNAMDPAPFHERDLDPNAVQYIVDWAREAHTAFHRSRAASTYTTSATSARGLTSGEAGSDRLSPCASRPAGRKPT
jgi:hypothetical protein